MLGVLGMIAMLGVIGLPVAALSLWPGTARAVPVGVVSRVQNPDGLIAITFDACATATQGYGFDRDVYEILEREHVPATIFVSGRWVEFHPDVMKELAANPLIEFGNHSYDHPHMSELSPAEIRREVARTEAALAVYHRRSVAFRPPFGDLSPEVLETVRGMGLPVVLWDVVSGDPSAKVTTEGIIHAVTRGTRSGSIVIFHINGRGWKTASALPTVLSVLHEKGFVFAPLSRLMAARPANRPLPLSVETPVENPSGALCEVPALHDLPPPELPACPDGAVHSGPEETCE